MKKLGRSIARKAFLNCANAVRREGRKRDWGESIKPVSIERMFLSEIRRQLALMLAEPALIEGARSTIDVEVGSLDSTRNQAIIDDALFARRINAIWQE
ncbi:hypothetical protein OH764_00820 [Burkholderia sp. M6-3]